MNDIFRVLLSPWYPRDDAADFVKASDALDTAIATAARLTDKKPTPAQAQAGNYRKGRFDWNGLTVAIENPKGSTRHGYDADGKITWSNTMHGHYGYFLAIGGKDGDPLDVFVGDNPAAPDVFVVNQLKKDKSFDEHKVIIGCDNAADAKKLYLAHYPDDWTGFGDMTGMTLDEFKTWSQGDLTKRASDLLEFSQRNFSSLSSA